MAHGHVAHSPNDPADFTGTDAQYFETPPGAEYEHTDADVWTITRFGIWLAVSVVIVHVGIGLLYLMMIERAKDVSAPRYPLASGQQQPQPPEPRLQQFPRNDLYHFSLQENAAVSGYGWVDKGAGITRIPVADAMRKLVEEGLPTQPPAGGVVTPGLRPSDASGGLVMERRRQ